MSAQTDAPALFIVGIGASAGGLEALSAFLGHVEFDSAAFVIVQHLAPTQRSLLTELLARASRLQVATAEQGAEVRVNHVYVAPPNSTLGLMKGVLQVRTPDLDLPRLPIDSFFRSLAEDVGPRAIGVVLSGTGSDGTLGCVAIKASGGVTFAQDPATAKFDGMPRSVIDSGAADFCLSPEAIADEIYRVGNAPTAGVERLRDFEAHVGELSALIKKEFSLDLTHYKPTTTERRIARRMTLHRLDRLAAYIELCRTDPQELAALHADLLINVTAFFRDPQSYEVLLGTVIPRILERKGEAETVRVWVPGCSSGEEAYSIGICLLEKLDELRRSVKVQIFGTDLDAAAIQQARRGSYPATIASSLSPERLRKYFVKMDDGRYQVSRQVRDLVVFSVQNVCVDAPFSRLDLVSCRNLLIYLQPSVQQKVLRVLRYSLLPESFLMLGSSESIGESAELFSLLDRTNKFYVAKHVALPTSGVQLTVGTSPATPVREVVQTSSARPMVSIAHLADRKILEQYSPPGVVINDNLSVLYFRGRVRPYLEQPSGVATHDVLRLVRPELYPTLKAALERAFRDNEVVEVEGQLRDEALGIRPISIVVHPLVEPETRSRCLLVLFREGQSTQALVAPPLPERSDERSRLLEQELTLTKDYLQTTIEELERSNEDLKAANEELQSSNEELQATNEELETAKEELQSTNEELITLNEELQRRMLDLGSTHDDLRNVLVADDRAIVVIGLDQRLRLFSPAAARLLNLVATDTGRTLSQLEMFLGGESLEALVTDSIQTVTVRDRQFQGRDGRGYFVRVIPYKTAELAIRGAVISLSEVTTDP